MKRVFVSSALVCAFAVAIMASSAAPSNFAGTWVLDKTKSEGLQRGMSEAESVTLVVTQDGKQIVTETKVVAAQAPASQPITYNLDGSETTAELGGRFPGKATLKAKWMGDGKALELTQVRNVQVQGNDVTITTTDHWELAEGGKALTIHRKTESPRGTQESKLYFNKK